MFLDEIADLAPELQPKLLEVLETGTVRRLGGSRAMTVDVRLIAATNRDLGADLYARLSVTPLRLPAVRERSRDDRLALLTRILADFAPQIPGCPSVCSAEALDRLLSAPWPGNVREMRNVVERAMILARGAAQLGVDHLPADLRNSGSDKRHQPQALADVERGHIEKTLRFHGGNRTRAALELGISRATLINKIKVYGLDL
jgi:two-component system response regulator HydG